MKYPAKITSDDGLFAVSFIDIPEALTCGDTLEEALEMAQDALETAMDFYFEGNRTVPAPSPLKDGDYAITLPASMAAKILLLNEMLAQRITPSELARRMNTTRQEANRFTDLHHVTKIDRIAAAARALGRELEVTFA